jgi:hypothetical protein
MFITFLFFCSSISWRKQIFKLDILSFEYKPDGFLSDKIEYLSLDRNYEYNENNRMKKRQRGGVGLYIFVFLQQENHPYSYIRTMTSTLIHIGINSQLLKVDISQ